MKATRGRILLPKHFVRNYTREPCSVSRKLLKCARIFASLLRHLCAMRPSVKLIRRLALLCVLLLLLYGVSPYFSFWRFTVALRSGDRAAISSRVDFPAIRTSLKKQLVARFAHVASGHKRWSKLGPTLIDAIVDAYATPDGIAAILSNPGALKNLQAPHEFQFSTGKNVNWLKVKYAFFVGPRTFVVDREGIKLRFRFTGMGWQLNNLDLGLGEATR
jgi:hypothetical protein